jgi:DNA-binding transcriptional regulator/RsmH inhibitor MraZ
VEPPLHVSQASVDDKGRLKLPERFQTFLEATGVRRVFITTFDLRHARIYPIDLWLANLKVLQADLEDPDRSERVLFWAKVHGGEAELDGQGRLLLPSKLREVLELDSRQPVWLDASFNGCILLLTKKDYDQRLAEAQTKMPEDLPALKRKGWV